MLNLIQNLAKADACGLKMEDPVERAAKDREEEDQKDQGELKRAFVVPHQQMQCGCNADQVEGSHQPTQLIGAHKERDQERELRKN